ncbi:hypothetical protein K431DRAFT_307129 [Polychaeton citri CBS 116435]|uniref:Uncharacterized protein n=1 Tax=Polychaeton citri CBS 116435 TaxID=1314669 RepID=A0A9P4PYC6_9PEZI|nr:hypothetical protein K431DRAFT_307129 [Polychaeton citri CBS 116435]
MASGFLQVQTPTLVNGPATPLSDADDFYSVLSRTPTASEHGRDEEDGGEAEEEALEPPTHPVPSLQAAFEESIDESSNPTHTARQSMDVDANVRRKRLLEKQDYDNAWTSRWKQPRGARFHPLVKQIAQIIFGMYLLQQQQAKSDEEVVKILQTHVDEVDSFLEKTVEDFDLAVGDIEERLRFLKLPMTHLDVFDTMLDDKKFRTQLLEGNDKIEKIIDRTTKALQGSMHDIRQGKDVTKELGRYLDSIRTSWPHDHQDLAPIYTAMKGNEEGWKQALRDLQSRGHVLGDKLAELTSVVGEMAKLAGAASRRDKKHARSVSSSQSEPGSPRLRSRFNRNPPPMPVPTARPNHVFFNKPLPMEPDAVAGAGPRRSVSKPSSVPFADRYESPRQQPRTPSSPPGSPRSTVKTIPFNGAPPSAAGANGMPVRPRTAGTGGMAAREARNTNKRDTAELAEFLKLSGPLNSNPPDHLIKSKGRKGSSSGKDDSLGRSKSHGAVDVMNALRSNNSHVHGHPARAQSHGASSILSRPKTSGSESASKQKGALDDNNQFNEGIDRGVGSGSRTAFSRRMSKRMKQIPTPFATSTDTAKTIPSPKLKPILTLNGSTNVSDPNGAPNSYTSTPVTVVNGNVPSNSFPPAPTHEKSPSSDNQKRKQLNLFPATAPLTPSAASFRSGIASRGPGSRSVSNATLSVDSNGGDVDSITALPMHSPAGSTRMSKSRTFSIRNVFHRKKVSGVF